LDSNVHDQHEESTNALIEKHKQELAEETERRDAFWKEKFEKELRERSEIEKREWEQRLVAEREQLLANLVASLSPSSSSSSPLPILNHHPPSLQVLEKIPSKVGLSLYHNCLIHSQLVLLFIVLVIVVLTQFPDHSGPYHLEFRGIS